MLCQAFFFLLQIVEIFSASLQLPNNQPSLAPHQSVIEQPEPRYQMFQQQGMMHQQGPPSVQHNSHEPTVEKQKYEDLTNEQHQSSEKEDEIHDSILQQEVIHQQQHGLLMQNMIQQPTLEQFQQLAEQQMMILHYPHQQYLGLAQQQELWQQAIIQQQMLDLHRQHQQVLQYMKPLHYPMDQYLSQPMLVFLPPVLPMMDSKGNELFKHVNEINHKKQSQDVFLNKDTDSISVDADFNNINRNTPTRAILLLPNARFSIGGIISNIPWLPFEVNVPDSIAWAYNGIANGISGIISIIEQRLPWRPNRLTPQSVMMKSQIG